MSAEAQAAETPSRDGIKDTIESIVVALILAFVFRAFVVEAFVIPTGSMAPTLYGAHGMIVCEDCGTEFAYGLKDLKDSRSIALIGEEDQAVCPNCNRRNSARRVNDRRGNPESGDRILVFKWPYDLGIDALRPARWDVVVFKDPADGTTNFIKRLVGLPNEVLMILDGDVYAVPLEDLSEEALADLDQLRHEKYVFRTTGNGHRRLRDPNADTLAELDRKMTIPRKTPEAQEALWFVVYDNDYPPQERDPDQPFWKADRRELSGWETSGRRIHFEARGTEQDYIELKGKAVLAEYAYNIRQRYTPPPVADQRVRFVLTPRSIDGTLKIRLSKLDRTFWASIHTSGLMTLTESRDGRVASSPIARSYQAAPFSVGESVEISMENVDYRVALSVGNREVLATSDDPNGSAYYGPDIAALQRQRRPAPALPPRIYGESGTFDITHLVVERDVYYYHPQDVRALAILPWAPYSGWASPSSPMMLRSHECFMLGDNTAASKDGRLWDAWGPHLESRGEGFQLGTVPLDQLIGKAFFVYWPSPGRIDWLQWLPVVGGNVVPDVGRMRWIR